MNESTLEGEIFKRIKLGIPVNFLAFIYYHRDMYMFVPNLSILSKKDISR